LTVFKLIYVEVSLSYNLT